MRKMLVAVCLIVFSLSTVSQIAFKTSDTTMVRQLSDSLALNAKRDFVFVKQGRSVNDKNYYAVVYNDKEDENNRMTVAFRVSMIGANQALEIEGTPEYEFEFVYGKFLDLFPFWKKFIDESANAEQICTGAKKAEMKINGKTHVMRGTGSGWMIRNLHY